LLSGFSTAGMWNGPTGVTLLSAFSVTFAATFAVRRLAIAIGWYDRPDAGLKSHSRPIPYLGGMAMFAGWCAASVVHFVTVGGDRSIWSALWAGGALMALTGLVDDRIHLRPRTRLILEALVAGVLALAGVGRRLPFLVTGGADSDLSRWLVQSGVGHAATVILLIGFLVYTTNATNLIDGLDGLCAGVTAIMGAGYLVLVATLRERAVLAAGPADFLVTLSAAQIAICLAFLCYNFNPASIFMGDSGSLLLGFNVAVILVMLGDATSMRWLAAGIAIFGFPILDTTLAVVRRWKNGRPLFVGDRSHLYDQLRDRGFTVRQTAMVCYLIGGAFAGLGLMALTSISTVALFSVYLTAAAVSAVALVRGGMLRVDDAAARSGTPH